MIGAGWMGQVHARAYARLAHHYPQLGVRPRLVAVADPVDGARADFMARYAPERVTTDWRELLTDPRIEAVSVTAPNLLHRQIGCAVAQAGRHLWIEKPVGLGAADAQAVADAVAAAGVVAAVGFNYRTVPALARARAVVADGGIGAPTHARIALFTDYAAHPRGALSWRFTLAQGGHGVLGDLASHGVDLARYLLGDLDRLVADTATFITERPTAPPGGRHYDIVSPQAGTGTGVVENEDYVAALARARSGARVVIEASRADAGEQNRYTVEVHGSRGMLAWDFRRSDELLLSTGQDYQNQAAQIVFAGPGDGDYAAFQPASGNAMGYDDTKVAEAAHFVAAVAGRGSVVAGMADAVASARALDAMVTSAREGRWVTT